MAQASGSHFKLIYQDWITVRGVKFPAPNCLHPMAIKLIEEDANVNGYHPGTLKAPFYEHNFQRNNSGYYFRHGNFVSFFEKHFGYENIVETVDITDDCEYIYPIEIEWSGFNYLINPAVMEYKGKEYEYKFKDCFRKDILELINSGKVKLVIHNIIDPSPVFSYVEEVKDSLVNCGIKEEQIVFMFGNTPYEYNRQIHKFTILGAKLSLQQASKTINDFPHHNRVLGYINDNVKETDLDNSIVRKQKFVCFNRTLHRPHRVAMAYLAFKYNLVKDNTFSFLTYLGTRPEVIRKIKELVPDNDVEDIVDSFMDKIPYEIDTKHLSMQEKESFQTVNSNNKELYLDTYIHIVSETQFDVCPTPFFSEKTWRPIINLQPFIYLGNYKALDHIKDLGFKTFDKWIDESYDNELDPYKRFQIIRKEIERFNRMDINDIHSMYFEMKDILIHNQNLIKTFENYNPFTELFDGI
jgi:hypothetical protein